ncbi:unnamed protein product [Durusdinium trenchii]|uniref:EF-hand domain-containing protein n=1 Tax=Durusdinium trenchii TaxID=1381693 RepID=A0ABP0SGT4_9DINO
MSVLNGAFVASAHAHRQSKRWRSNVYTPTWEAEDRKATAERLQRVMKGESSSMVENMVNDLIGRGLNQEKEPVKTSVVDSKIFHCFIYGTIILNALTLGMQADFQTGSWPLVWLIFENVFTAVFTIEMVLKIYFLRLEYFWNAGGPVYWNLLDFVIAWLAIADCWILSWQDINDAPLLRAMQLLRIIRIAKLIGLRQELVAIMEGLFSSLECMVWIGFLLLIAIYSFGIVCRNVMGDLTNADFEHVIDNDMYFGTLPRTMLTLFNIALIENWAAVIWPQMLYNPWMVLPLIFFMCVTCFGLMNALIGVIVERTTAAQQNMSSLEEEKIREMKMLMVAQLLEAIDASDEDESGTINLQEFRQVQRKPYAAQIFAALNLPPGFEAKDLFGLLDADGDGVLDRYEFLLGICRLIWCDDFQSKCLMSYQISQVREDIRALRSSVLDLSQSKVDSISEDLVKSISASVRKDYQEILDERLAHWEPLKATLGRQRTATGSCQLQADRRSGSEGDPPGSGTAAGVSLEEVEGLLESIQLNGTQAAPPSWTIQLRPEILEAVEQSMERLTSACGAQRLMLRADGLLCVEGSRATVERLAEQLHELYKDPGADSGEEEVFSQPGEAGEASEATVRLDAGLPKGRRKPRRAKKAKVSQEGDWSAPRPGSVTGLVEGV